MRTQGEDGHLQAKERDLTRNQPCCHLDLGLPASRVARKYISVVYTASLWYFVTANLANEYRTLFSLPVMRAAPGVTIAEFQGFMHPSQPTGEQAFEYFYLEFLGKRDGWTIFIQ